MRIKEILQDQNKRHKLIVAIGLIYSYVWGITKIILGIFVLGFLYCLSGIDTLFIGISKHIYLKNLEKKSRKASIIVSSFIVLIGLIYALYAIRLFFLENIVKEYSTILAISIASFSFVELGIAIKNLFKKSMNTEPLVLSFRTLSFSVALFAIVNAQNAILMATSHPDNFADGLFGVLAGLIAVIIGLYSLHYTIFFDNKKNDT